MNGKVWAVERERKEMQNIWWRQKTIAFWLKGNSGARGVPGNPILAGLEWQ
jgi:hypothetical protein